MTPAALGGIRTPSVDVPVSTLTGEPPTPGGEQLCALLGQSTPFDQTKLTSLYSNRQTYLDTFDDALDRAVTW